MSFSVPTSLNSANASDKSIGFFNDIFGTGWESILEGQTPTGGASATLLELFYAFNAVTLACVTVLMFYIVSAGVVGTAHEGESLGKRYSTLWTPIRGALAVSFLMPLPWAKLSLLQALALKFIFFSIGGASYLAGQSIDKMIDMGGAFTMPQAPMPMADEMAIEILNNLVIQEYFLEREQRGYGSGITSADSGQVKSFVFNAPNDVGFSTGMGSIKASCEGAASVCADEIASITTMVDELRPIAKDIVSMWSGGAQVDLGDGQKNQFWDAVKNYATASQNNAVNALSALNGQYTTEAQTLKQSIENNGWAWLGTYYWKLAKINDHAYKLISTKASVGNRIDFNAVIKQAAAYKEIETAIQRYDYFVKGLKIGKENQIAISQSGDPAGLGSLAGSLFMDGLISSLPGNNNTALTGAAEVLANTIAVGDPINNLQQLGHQLINAGSITLTSLYGLKMGASIIDKIMPSGVGNLMAKAAGVDGVDGEGITGKLFGGLIAMLLPVILVLMLTGITLAYYLPTLPFIIWVSAIVGWLVLTMELIVATSIWAAMHAVPEGEGMAGQHGRQGYMLFLGILIRPALHVIGFFMAFIITYVVGHFIGEVYLDFIASSGQNDEPTGPIAQIIGWVATLLIGSSMMIVSLHKVYGLVTWLGDNLLRWAGAGQPSLGEHNDESRISSMVAGAIYKAQSPTLGRVGEAFKPAGGSGVKMPKVKADRNIGRDGQVHHTGEKH